MAGGIFKASSPKVRPGTYVNVISGKQPTAAESPNGIAMIPLIGYDWGPRGEWIHLTSEGPDSAKAKLGRSIYDDNYHMEMLQLLFLNATEVYVYICGGGTAASGTIETEDGEAAVKANYPGSLGNSIQLASVANPLGGFDVSVYLDGSEVELFEAIETADQITSEYVTVDGASNLVAFASASLSGGEDDESKTNSTVTDFLDKAEKIKFNCMAFPTTDSSLISALITKIRYIRESIGWKCQAVVVNTAADYEGIYNLVNSFTYDGGDLDTAQATAWLAGAVAGADYVTTLTYDTVAGAIGVVGEMSNEEAIEAIKSGETYFTVDESGNVILEYDVNSKVTFSTDDPADYNKGRPSRVYDTIANDLLLTFIPGKFNNDSTGWSVMEGLGKAMLQKYQDDGAITNVDVDNDFKVDQGSSSGDSVYVNVAIQAVDSAEKYYFTVIAN